MGRVHAPVQRETFSFQADVFDKMVKQNGYKMDGSSSLFVSGSGKPAWWTQDKADGDSRYVREGSDGTTHYAQLWHDAKTGFVYWHQVETD